ncbi:MAG: pyridoxamine 5-phosphate oxidase [Bacteroidota bacterium]|jgi:pyridoxamine 5'-phosphate oxidase
MNIADLRQDYRQKSLDLSDTEADAMGQFKKWFQEALNANILEPNAMTAATCSKAGKPSARIVLLKNVTEKGFTFFTNYDSKKGHDLAENPSIALVFNWLDLQRQIRIEGIAYPIEPHLSDEYFHSRPRASQLGAIASPQSQVVTDRAVLEKALQSVTNAHAEETTLPRPAHWGGYEVMPNRIEFWQGRRSRLHDRIVYTKLDNGTWERSRLAP